MFVPPVIDNLEIIIIWFNNIYEALEKKEWHFQIVTVKWALTHPWVFIHLFFQTPKTESETKEFVTVLGCNQFWWFGIGLMFLISNAISQCYIFGLSTSTLSNAVQLAVFIPEKVVLVHLDISYTYID